MKSTLPDTILERVPDLPPLPAAVARLLHLTHEPDVDFREIAKVISLDQALTARLLRVANSAFYGFPQQIRTVQQALVVLGTYTVRNLALSFSVMNLRHQMDGGALLDTAAFWRHSTGVACAARLLARPLRLADAEEAFVAGLLHDVGKLILARAAPDVYGRLLRQAADRAASLHALEEEAFGFDHAAAGYALCRHWNIPETLADAVASHHDGGGSGDPRNALPYLVRLADNATKLYGIGFSGNPLIPIDWAAAPDGARLAGERVSALLQSLPAEVAEAERVFGDAAPYAASGDGAHPRLRSVLLPGRDENRLLLGVALHALHFDPVTRATERPLFGVIADESLPAAERDAYTAHGVRVLDFARWRAGQPVSGQIDAEQLRTWLDQALSSVIQKAS